jgi:hypothetical protein
VGAEKKGIIQTVKILAITNFDERFTSIKNVVEPNNKKYFKKYNIDYVGFCGDFDSLVTIESDEPIVIGNEKNYWTKMILMQSALSSPDDHDWIFMLDADCLIVDHSVDYLRTIIKMSKPDKEFLLCNIDDPLTNYWNINNGVFFVKKTERMKKLFTKLVDFAFGKKFTIDDQSIVQYLLRENIDEIRKITDIFPSHAFNHGGNFIFHACGVNSHHGDFKQALLEKEETLKSKLSEITTT